MTFIEPEISTPRAISWRNRTLWLVLWTALACGIAWAGSQIAWNEVWAALQRADLLWVTLAVCVNLCGLPFWALAMRQFIPTGEPRPFWRLTEVLAIAVAAIQIFSVLGGGATAFYLFRRRIGLSIGAIVSVITLEQITTGLVKALVVGLAVLSAAAPAPLRMAGASLLAVVGVAFLALLWAAHSRGAVQLFAQRFSGLPSRLLAHFADWTEHLEALRRPARFLGGVGFTICRRIMETTAILCIQKAAGIPVSIELALFVIAAIMLATIIPGPPGNLGYYEAVVVVAYGWGGISAETAVAAALLQHLAFLLAALTPGCLLFALFRRRYVPTA